MRNKKSTENQKNQLKTFFQLILNQLQNHSNHPKPATSLHHYSKNKKKST